MPESAGLATFFDGLGGKEEREFLMCVHCQAMWYPVRGSGRQRGFCLKCNGVTCGSHRCVQCFGPADRDNPLFSRYFLPAR